MRVPDRAVSVSWRAMNKVLPAADHCFHPKNASAKWCYCKRQIAVTKPRFAIKPIIVHIQRDFSVATKRLISG
jgi:hypothetical protein